MADIIDFSSIQKEQPKEYTNTEVCKLVLNDLLKNINSLKDLYIFYKTDDDLINVIETDVSFQDRSVMVQLLQHHINLDLVQDDYVEEELEPDV